MMPIVQKMIMGVALIMALPLSAQPPDRRPDKGPETLWRAAYIQDGAKSGERLIQEGEEGFAELQHLFLATLSEANTIGRCCTGDRPAVTLFLRESYYVRLGGEQVLVAQLDLYWPKKASPRLVLNQRFELQLDPDDENLQLLSRWAEGRNLI